GARQRRHGLADLSHGTTAGAIALWSNLLRGAVALDNRDVAFDRAFHRLLAAARDDAVEERAVDHVERPRLEHGADARPRPNRERNDVGIAAHEAHVFAVGDQLHDIAAQQRAPPFSARRPVQHRPAGEVAAAADERYPARERQGIALPQLDDGVG